MKTRVQKWGNSLAVRIPQHFVREAGLEYNAPVEMNVEDGKLVIQRAEASPSLEAILANISKDNLHTTIDTGPAAGDEVW